MTASRTVVRFFLATDRRDWPAVRAAMSDRMTVDYTSLSGGEPEEVPADDLVGRWQGLLPGFDATQHLLGPPAETPTGPADVTVECAVRAFHRLGTEEWVVVGSYTLGVVRVGDDWRLAAITLHTSYQDGDPTLAERAAERAAAG